MGFCEDISEMSGKVFVFLAVFVVLNDLGNASRPQFELNPQYSDSYLPATMQVIAYLTEAMKYELRPQPAQPAQPTTTAAPRPTPPHRPGVFAPVAPPPHRGFKAILTKKMAQSSLGSIIRQHEPFLPAGIHELDLELLGDGAKDLHRAINIDLADNSFEDFLETFDDDARNSDLLRWLKQKKVPPTRAYVTLLSIYDLFNKETKRLGLNRFNGFSETIVKDLNVVSGGSSAYQLGYLLRKVQDQKEVADPMLQNKIKALIGDLEKEDSYINIALMYIPALGFAL